jgi:DNA-binding PadR family transcriptional regulator
MTVKHGILGLLALQPRYGYELRAAFLAVVGGEQNWDVKPAQIYSTLARLEEAGLVKAQGGRKPGEAGFLDNRPGPRRAGALVWRKRAARTPAG